MEKAHLYEALFLVNHGIDEAVRGVQRLKKSPKLFMETYHKSMAGLERRRSIINLQFMLEMRELEENDESYFEEEFNVWLAPGLSPRSGGRVLPACIQKCNQPNCGIGIIPSTGRR